MHGQKKELWSNSLDDCISTCIVIFQAGGFQVPFITSGAFMIAVGVVLWIAAPSPECRVKVSFIKQCIVQNNV